MSRIHPVRDHTEPGMREFAWWLDHPRLYRLIGYRWLSWRHRKKYLAIPSPHPAPPEAIELGRQLAERYGWRKRD